MKAGIIGLGAVGARQPSRPCNAAPRPNSSPSTKNPERSAKPVALDLGYGAPLSATRRVRAGDYEALASAGIVVITAGVNEKTGGATDRQDAGGRLRLLDQNIRVMQDHRAASRRSGAGSCDLDRHRSSRSFG